MDIDPDKFNILEDMDQVMFGRPESIFKVTLKRYIVAANHSIITSEEDSECYWVAVILCIEWVKSSFSMSLDHFQHWNP